jgi:hypothetical protein
VRTSVEHEKRKICIFRAPTTPRKLLQKLYPIGSSPKIIHDNSWALLGGLCLTCSRHLLLASDSPLILGDQYPPCLRRYFAAR